MLKNINNETRTSLYEKFKLIFYSNHLTIKDFNEL